MSVVLAALFGLGIWLIITPAPARATAETTSSIARLQHSIRGTLTRAGLERMPIGIVAVSALVLGLMIGGLTLGLTGVVILALLAALAGTTAPILLITWKAGQRRQAARLVWPDAVDHLVSGVRAGLALPEAISALGTSGPELLRGDFEHFAREYRRTGNLSASLDTLKDRLADPTADRMIETLRLAREVGGTELPSILRSLAVYLREEQAIRHEVEARQSWVMNAARLGVAAPWIVLALLATRPEAAEAYNAPGGVLLIIAGLAVTVLAYLIMRRIGRLRDDRRWFA